MNRKYLSGISIGIAVLVFGSIAYAADRRKHAKTVDRLCDKTREEESLRAELTNEFDRQEKKHPEFGHIKKAAGESNGKKDAALLAEFTNK